MAHLQQKPNGSYSARRRLLDDVREEYGCRYGARFEAKFSAPASVGRLVAGQKFRAWDAEVTQRIETIRRMLRGEGIDLDREQAAALAGEWYNWFVARHEKEEADPVAYDEAVWDIIEAMRGFAPDEVREEPLKDMEWTRAPEGQVQITWADGSATSHTIEYHGGNSCRFDGVVTAVE
jgi:hypothetical protein